MYLKEAFEKNGGFCRVLSVGKPVRRYAFKLVKDSIPLAMESTFYFKGDTRSEDLREFQRGKLGKARRFGFASHQMQCNCLLLGPVVLVVIALENRD